MDQNGTSFFIKKLLNNHWINSVRHLCYIAWFICDWKWFSRKLHHLTAVEIVVFAIFLPLLKFNTHLMRFLNVSAKTILFNLSTIPHCIQIGHWRCFSTWVLVHFMHSLYHNLSIFDTNHAQLHILHTHACCTVVVLFGLVCFDLVAFSKCMPRFDCYYC